MAGPDASTPPQNRVHLCFFVSTVAGTITDKWVLQIGSHEFKLAEAAASFSCFNWPRPSALSRDYGDVVLVKLVEVAASTDATLKALSLGAGVTLDPTFASGTTSYMASVANSVSSVTVTAAATDDNATVAITGDTDTSTPNTATLDLTPGANTVTVTVTAEDTTTTEIYTVTVTRAAAITTNTPATGAPTITGTAQVDQTLTAVTTGIMDDDGLTSVTYTYQWIRVDGAAADIAGALSSTYTLVAADLGETLTVRVTFDDDAGNTETLTSAATATVVAATVAATAPTVSAVAVTSSPASGDTYGTGEMIRFTVTFDQDVTVTGTPEFEFCLGSSATMSCSVGTPPPALRSAALSSGSGTTALVFSYTVVAGDMDTDGIWIGNQDRTIKLDAADAIRGTGGGARCRADPRGGGRPERPQGQWRDDHQHPRDGRADHHGHGAGGPDADGGHHRHHG